MKRVFTDSLNRHAVIAFLLLVSAFSVSAQETLPAPGPARSVTIPTVKEKKLRNGLTVAVIEKKGVPVVSVQLLVRAGASFEDIDQAGLANLTADMLPKGTKLRSAEQIAGQTEFLGSSINSGAGWNSSSVSMTITSDKLDAAMTIFADVVRNASFQQKELDLLKAQTIDELKANLQQPGYLANYVASVHSFNEHPPGGTPESIQAIDRSDLLEFYKDVYEPNNSILMFAGDISAARAVQIATRYFGMWKGPSGRKEIIATMTEAPSTPPENVVPVDTQLSILILDLPKSGQASVNYLSVVDAGRVDLESSSSSSGRSLVGKGYYPALVLNSLLGGGYSSRLNQEIRIKRGLSYGAGSNFAWRWDGANFAARAQTKDESAGVVAELMLAEIHRLVNETASEADLTPRKSVLTGGFGRSIETSSGLLGALSDLYTFELSTDELNDYTRKINNVTPDQLRDFARSNLTKGHFVIAGDYSIFKDDLAKRFPNAKIEVIKASEVDITKPDLRK